MNFTLAGQRRRVSEAGRAAEGQSSRRRSAAACSFTARLGRTRSRRARSSSAPRRPTRSVQTVSGRQGENGPRYVYARLRPELKTVAKDAAVRPARRLPARHVAERASRPLRRQHDAAQAHPRRRRRHQELQRPRLQRRRRLGRRRRAGCRTRRKAATRLWPGSTASCSKGRPTSPAPWTSWSIPASTWPPARRSTASCCPTATSPGARATWPPLVAKFDGRSPMTCRFHCYRTGLGAENLELYEALTRKGGGIFNCYGEADLKAAAAGPSQPVPAHRAAFASSAARRTSDVLVAGRRAAVYPGGELILAARVNGTGRVDRHGRRHLPRREVRRGVPDRGRQHAASWPRAPGPRSPSASLLALNDPKLDGLVTAYCQQFGIVGRTASFLVLENDADYKRFNLEEERGKTLVTDVGEFLDNAWATMGKAVGARESFVRFLDRIENRVNVRKDASVTQAARPCSRTRISSWPPAPSTAASSPRRTCRRTTSTARQRDRREVGTYLTEVAPPGRQGRQAPEPCASCPA